MLKKKNILSLAIPVILLTACGGGDSSDDTTFSLSLSDAPVDELSKVVICFNQVELKGGSNTTLFTVGDDAGVLPADNICGDTPNTVGIDLTDYTGDNSISLLSNVDVEPGNYTQLRLTMSEGSYGILDGDDDIPANQIPIIVPSNELKLDGFTVAQGGNTAYTLEFDLRKSMTNPVGREEYILKPRGVRLVDDNEVGTLFGSASTELITNTCEVSSPVAGDIVGAVYLYLGTDLDPTMLEDNTLDDKAIAPLASTTVTFDGASYAYEIGFILAETYTVAFTCNSIDAADVDEVILFEKITENVDISVGIPTEVSFVF